MKKAYFEDINLVDKTEVYDYPVTEREIIDFASTWDPMPFHIDVELAKASVYRGLTACGAHIYGIFVKLAHGLDPKMAVIAAVASKEMTFNQPIRPGDTLHLQAECLSLRESASKQDRGLAEFQFTLVNQRGEVAFQMLQVIMLAKRGSGLDVFSRA